MSEERKLIWTSEYDPSDAEIKEIFEEYTDMTEDEIVEMLREQNSEDLAEYIRKEAEKIPMERGVIIAALGLWNGPHQGYRHIKAKTLAGIFEWPGKDIMDAEWFVEHGDVYCVAKHHDGTNTLRFRMYKEDADDDEIDKFEELLWYGKCTEDDIREMTESVAPLVGKMLGWK